jgi:acylpyruvate hydrolase
MKLVTFKKSKDEKKYHIGELISDSEIVELTSLKSKESLTANELFDCFNLENDFLEKAKKARDLPKINRAKALICSPVPRPGKIICIGLNYRDHAEESGMAIPQSPIIFSKFGTCVVGPNDSILLPPGSEQVDYEAEFAFVIGKTAKLVSREKAMEHVLGYTNFNDVSARDFQFADGQWVRGKSCDTFAPMGEFIATTDEINDPHDLRIRFRLNGQTLQDSRTDQLIFKIPELIEFLSKSMTLEPGDVIATGTPPGVGFARKPPIFLKNGDVAEVEIEGLGVLRNSVKST